MHVHGVVGVQSQQCQHHVDQCQTKVAPLQHIATHTMHMHDDHHWHTQSQHHESHVEHCNQHRSCGQTLMQLLHTWVGDATSFVHAHTQCHRHNDQCDDRGAGTQLGDRVHWCQCTLCGGLVKQLIERDERQIDHALHGCAYGYVVQRHVTHKPHHFV